MFYFCEWHGTLALSFSRAQKKRRQWSTVAEAADDRLDSPLDKRVAELA